VRAPPQPTYWEFRKRFPKSKSQFHIVSLDSYEINVWRKQGREFDLESEEYKAMMAIIVRARLFNERHIKFTEREYLE
jgi:hypothetical protein